jgi:hypothetical protein
LEMFANRLLAVFCIFLLTNAALAQTQTQSQTQSQTPIKNESSAVVVTASVTASGAIRLAGPQQVSQMRLEVLNSTGDVVFDSGLRQGNVVDWNEASTAAAIVDGSYLLVVTTKDLQGKSHQRLATLNREAAQSTLKRSADLTASKLEASTEPNSLVILSDRSDRSLVVSAHDGENAQVTATTGSLTLRTGDFYSDRTREQMRITPEGRVGIGIEKPEATLDVAGEVRARGGIRFDDGTLLTTAGNTKKKDPNAKEEPPTAESNRTLDRR